MVKALPPDFLSHFLAPTNGNATADPTIPASNDGPTVETVKAVGTVDTVEGVVASESGALKEARHEAAVAELMAAVALVASRSFTDGDAEAPTRVMLPLAELLNHDANNNAMWRVRME